MSKSLTNPLGKGGGKKSNPAADAQLALATKLIDQTDPLRAGLIDRSTDFINGGLDPTMTPSFAALKQTAGDQFASARDSAISTLPEGGGLSSALVDLQGKEAQTLTQGAAGIYDDELSRALALGTGITGLGSSAIGSAANTQAQIAAAKAQASAGKSSGLGAGVGALLGGK